MKTPDEYIESITLDRANLQYIADNLVINGSLLASLRKVMQEYAREACREQREICAAHYSNEANVMEYSESCEEAIKNAPEPKI